MPKSLTIPKDNSNFPEYLNWELLRKAGIEHIENLGSDLWTDYNLHDPGITLLEVLCYALTDLGYRTNFDIRDILARSPEDKNLAPKTIFGKPQDDNFFTAADILSCNPVTLDDYRKLLIDIPGVRNAWFELAPNGEVPVAFDRDLKSLVIANPASETEKPINLQGLYEVCLELEPLLVRDACGSFLFTKDGILEIVYKTLNAHRNLCEDLKKVSLYGEEQIQLCVQIELDAAANPENVLLEMYKKLENHLSPTLPFYTLQEMLKKGKSMEEIFEGRPLSTNSNGFIDTEELKELDPKRKLFASDFYRLIMEIDGVIAVRNLTLANAINDVVMHSGEKWCLNLTPKYRPHFDLKHSQITFYKGVLPFTTDKSIVEQRFLEEKAAKAKAKLEGYHLDVPIPEGQYREIKDYTSIMEEFPLTYGVGSAGIKGLIDVQRKGQAMQLKGYLLFFDQLLANYLAQLAHVRDLFSMGRDENRIGKSHTYFSQILAEVPGVEDLLENYLECDGNNEDDLPPEDFPTYLQYITENLENYQERRNRFLDHLLARFSESFSDYVLLMFEINGKQHDGERIIGNKADFLSSYPEISRNRGKAFDYTQPVGCTGENDCGEITKLEEENLSENVSGLEKRVAKLIGIGSKGWKNLAHSHIEKRPSGWTLIIQRENHELLIAKHFWETKQQACDAVKGWQEFLGNEQYYRRLTYEVKTEKEFAMILIDQNGNKIAIGTQRYPSISQFCEALEDHFSVMENIPDENVFLESIDGARYYLIRDENGEEFLRFQAIEEDLDIFKLIIKYKKNYCREAFPVERTQEYGFIIVNQQDECIAESSKRYLAVESREDTIYWLIGQIKWSGLKGEAKKEDECYFFHLFDFSGEKSLFESIKGFHSIALALEYFDPEGEGEKGFLHWAVQPENYEFVTKSGKHSFHLLNEEGIVTSLHPNWYNTETEAQHIQQAIIYYLNRQQPSFKIDGTPGKFEFEVSDTAGNVLFTSVGNHPTTVAAHSSTSLVKALAKHRRYYKPLYDAEKELSYGFELLDRSDVPFASHPQWYATECERDLALDAIIFYSENLSPLHRLTKKGSVYFLDMLSPNGDDLLNGMLEFPDKESALAYWENLLKHAAKPKNFHQDDSGDDKYPYGFKLLDKEENLIAKSALSYATKAESKMAFKAIVNLVRHTEWVVNITGDAGEYHFWIGDDLEHKVLESIQDYPDETVAAIAVKNILKWGQNRENYQITKESAFKLKDHEGNVIASHPHHYESDGEVESAIFMVINYLRNEAPKIDLPNKGGAFVPVIYDEKGKVAFKGSTIHRNKENALGELEKLAELASSLSNYKHREVPTSRCQNGFQLSDEDGKTRAIHPNFYPSSNERDLAMASIFGGLTHAEKLKNDVIKEIPYYGFRMNDKNENSLIESLGGWEDEGNVLDEFINFLEAASNLSNFVPNTDDETYGFRILSEKKEPLAKSIKPFENEKERDEAIKEIWLKVNLKNFSYRIFEGGEEEQWNFTIGEEEENDFLEGYSYLASKEDAAESLVSTFANAHNKDHFVTQENEEGKFTFHLVDKEGTIVARHAAEAFPTTDELDQAVQNFLESLNQNKLLPLQVKINKRYTLELNDLNGKSMLSGIRVHNSISSVESEWEQITEAIHDRANFEIVYDNLNCQYKIYISEENSVLAQSSRKIQSRTQAENWISQITFLLGMQPLNGDAIGTECGYYFLLKPADGVEEINGMHIKGTKRFPTTSEALRESMKAAIILLSDKGLRVEKKEDLWKISLFDENDISFANVLPPFEDEASALEAGEQLKEFVGKGGTLDCESEDTIKAINNDGSYFSTIVKDGKVFLESPNYEKKEGARAASNTIHELGQSEEGYNLITNEEECLYSFELTDKNGVPIASHPVFYPTSKERNDALKKTISMVNCEGLHLVEHILLRPRKVGMVQSYRFELIDRHKDSPIVQGETSYSSEQEARDALNIMWISLWKYANEEENEILVEKHDCKELPCKFSFNILHFSEDVNENKVIARSFGGFGSETKRDKQIDQLIEVIKDLEEEPDTELELPSNLEVRVYPLRLKDDLEGCELMKPILEHYIPGESSQAKYLDPYSFRATVVLPYWPLRFQRPEFREFIETTLRQEAPAHVFLRICWVDTKHMKDFEDAYCQWVSTLQSGLESCNAIEAKNKLIKTLCKLRSVYPVASLHDCEAPSGDSNRVVLNYSIIGSANS
jgi:hypothetical protein